MTKISAYKNQKIIRFLKSQYPANMGISSSNILSLLFCLILTSSFNTLRTNGNDDFQTYIVQVESPNDKFTTSLREADLDSWYRSFLPPTTAGTHDEGSSTARLVYAYYNAIKGFAAILSPQQVKEMEKVPGFVSARPERILSLHTSHSPNFLGLNQNVGLWNESSYGKGVIIGVLDTGVTPNHPSFSDKGMPPAPKKWKGECMSNNSASSSSSSSICNNKIIGARFFPGGDNSPVDQIGHGTHTASTAAGNFVNGANVFGNANGTASGIAPLAHVATYKVCNSNGCSESSLLAGLDAAISDGVDIISISIGGNPQPFYSDAIALGAFSAMEKGIFVSCSAGNDGPTRSSLSNEAPWVLTVGASTIDRKITATATLGNNQKFDGESVYQPKDFPPKQFPLYFPRELVNDVNTSFCSIGSINSTEARGKIVLCVNGGEVTRIDKGEAVKQAGGVGMIIINEEFFGSTTLAEVHVLPASHLSYLDGLKVLDYINSTTSPTASISFRGTFIGDKRAPTVAGFSSRGPSIDSPGILKPDIIGPGVNILAAWDLSVENITNSISNFNLESGTSMSCPHLSGVAALLKSVHPDWSPAAIKSAIMTTADQTNLVNSPIEDQNLVPADILAVGAGHVNPIKAINPGLIYDIKPKDYIPYLCGLNYTSRQMAAVLQRRFTCTRSIPEAELNYPSFSITFGNKVQTYTRTVTNVGDANSLYTVKVVPPKNVKVSVKPETLKFSRVNQKLNYQVTFRQQEVGVPESQGFLSWNSEKYSVRSPILVMNA